MRTRPFVLTFVCTANICRSAYADVRARQLLATHGSAVEVHSAGMLASPGHLICPIMATEAMNRGASVDWFHSRRLDAPLLRASDLVLTAEHAHLQLIRSQWPQQAQRAFMFTQFLESSRQAPAELRGSELVAWAAANAVAPESCSDIADPVGKGQASAATCAQELDDLLAQLLARLVGDIVG